MPFRSSAHLQVRDDDRGFVLTQPLIYEGSWERFTVPAGLSTDLASVPHSLTWLLPRYGGGVTRCALLHDFLSRDPLTAQRDADNLFERSLLEAGVSPLRARLLWAGVRVGNGPARADLLRLAALLPLAMVLLLPWLAVWPWQLAFRLLEQTSSRPARVPA